jgi:eukaryotic-like serine/threonine-protein kinase
MRADPSRRRRVPVSARVRVLRDDEHGLVAVKAAVRPGDAERLVHEARVLGSMSHPGVVELCELRPPAESPQLVTRWVSSGSLAERRLPVAQAAALIATVAETLGDLHQRGIVHGHLDATHVLIDRRGRPVLCSFGRAATAAGPPPGGKGRTAADDVAALGTLLTAVLEPGNGPPARFGSRRRRSSTDQRRRRALSTLADRACADDPTIRPSARALAAAIRALSADIDRAPRPATRAGARRLARVAPLVVAVVGATAILTATRGSDLPPLAEAPGQAVATPPSPEVGRTSIISAPSISLNSSPATTLAPSAPEVEHEGRRFLVGEPGDDVVVTGSTCPLPPTAVALRPATGDVFVFEGWAERDEEVRAPAELNLGPGARLLDVRGDDGCRPIEAVLADGTIVTVPLPGGPR